MRILRSADYRRMPWKNGGGDTREIAVWPTGAALDALDWRISLATVASNGPFSTFAGVTRTLCVIQGPGIALQVGNEPPRPLRTTSEPCTFDGDEPTNASLLDGPIVDLNVMTRRERFRHHVARHVISGSRQLLTAATSTVIFCQDGALLCMAASGVGELKTEDCAFIDGARQAVRLDAARRTEALVIELYREPASSGMSPGAAKFSRYASPLPEA
jgi:environmental stress-induced protein Ves